MNYILMAIPGFFILILLELVWSSYKKQDTYRLNDAINSLSIGVLSRITQILYAAIPFSIYAYCYEDFALLQWQSNAWTWLAAFILYDLSYYWVHRIGHTMNISWASHVIHHSSEEYNLTTALRQTSIPNVIGWVFYIPLAFMGFPPVILIAVGSLNLLYQFWVHTQVINKMPNWYEFIFVTPSNHRVHHAKNKVYIDKNYGGVFILWDRIFGTYQPELDNEKVIFGISTQLASWNPIWGNVHFITVLCKDAWHTHNWFDKLTLWFRRTGYRPADVEARFPITKSNSTTDKFDTKISSHLKWYLVAQLTIITLGVLLLMINVKELAIYQHFIIGITFTFSLYSLGRIQENKNSILKTEIIKFILMTAVASLAVNSPFWLIIVTVITALISLGWLYSIDKQSNHIQTA